MANRYAETCGPPLGPDAFPGTKLGAYRIASLRVFASGTSKTMSPLASALTAASTQCGTLCSPLGNFPCSRYAEALVTRMPIAAH